MAVRSDDSEATVYRVPYSGLRAPLSQLVGKEAEERVIIPSRDPSAVCLVLEVADAINALISSALAEGRAEPNATELATGLKTQYPEVYSRAISN